MLRDDNNINFHDQMELKIILRHLKILDILFINIKRF